MTEGIKPMKIYQSDSINELATALAKAQAEITHAKKSENNPFFKSKYADLSSVSDAARPFLSKNGLSVLQITDFDETGMTLVTQLNHSSGQWVRGYYPVRPVKADPQGYGSAVTYARRYAYSAITGVVAVGDDDDGNAATTGGNEAIDSDRAVEIDLKISEVKADKPKFLHFMGVDDVRKIKNSDYPKAINALKAKGNGHATA